VSDSVNRPDLDRVMAGLKDFQCETVDHVFGRLYTDPDAVSRFLVADEVGLGKTLVARGIIGKAIDHLWDQMEQINVLYICSNQAIARQNVRRLWTGGGTQFQHATRATLLPLRIRDMRGKLNFVSFTPGTSFNMGHRMGRREERVLLYHLLRMHWRVSPGRLSNMMRGNVAPEIWRAELGWREKEAAARLDAGLAAAFRMALDSKPKLRQEYDELSVRIGARRTHIVGEMWERRCALIGELRTVLACSSVLALQPQLVIMDEFQRFRSLLSSEEDTSRLARIVFSFPGVRVLLLSATPYKWYTMASTRSARITTRISARLSGSCWSMTRQECVSWMRPSLSMARRSTTQGHRA